MHEIDMGNLSLDDVTAQSGNMWPNAWDVPGHLHMVFNALKKGVQAMRQWPEIEKAFRSIANFLGKRGLRRRFVAKCCVNLGPQTALFKYWSGGNFSWRWEKLYVFLVQLVMRLPVLISRYDSGAMAAAGRQAVQVDGEIQDDEETKSILGSMQIALQVTSLHFFNEMLYVKVQAVCYEASWIEACYCHPLTAAQRETHLPGQHRKHEPFHCPWSGRRIVEMTLGHPEVAMRSIVEASSPQMNEMLSRMSTNERGECVAARDVLVTTITEEWKAKFSYANEYPIKFLKVLCPYIQ